MCADTHLQPRTSADPHDTWTFFCVLRINNIQLQIPHRMSKPRIYLRERHICTNDVLRLFNCYLNYFLHKLSPPFDPYDFLLIGNLPVAVRTPADK